MQFFGNEFFQAVEGISDAAAFKYLRVCWYYYHHNHCVGLLNDDEHLRLLTRSEKSEWPSIKMILFDNDKFFRQEEGLWHQGFCRQLYNQALAVMQRNQQRTLAARNARRH